MEPDGICGQHQHYFCSHGGLIRGRSILDVFSGTSRQGGEVLNKASSMSNYSMEVVKKISGSSVGYGYVLVDTWVGVLLGTEEGR